MTNIDEIIEVFGDLDKFNERLALMKNVQDITNQNLGKYAKVKNVEALEGNAISASREAVSLRDEAKALLAGAKKEAADIVDAAKSEAAGVRSEIMVARSALDKRARDVPGREKQVQEREDVCAARERESEEILAAARAKMDDAVAEKARIEKLSKNVGEMIASA